VTGSRSGAAGPGAPDHRSSAPRSMWLLLYRALVGPLLRVAMRCAGLLSPKVARGLAGRRRWREQIGSTAELEGRKRLHVHAASVGEFEQAKPIIEALRESDPGLVVTASFFSPSGYEQQGGYARIDRACYLPDDRPSEIRPFLDLLDPDLILIVRYDLWPELLVEASCRGIPVMLVCCVLRAGSARFRPGARGFFRWLYSQLSLIHAVGREDADALAALGAEAPVEVSGDTRYDRVAARAGAAAELPWLDDRLIAGRRVLVAGSTWPPDEEILSAVADAPGLLSIIVPHEPTPEQVAAARQRFPGAVTLSELERGDAQGDVPAVIVDRTGILSALYRAGSIAYVGGAFGEGVHSVLEPAAYGMPVLSGPKIERSRDAVALEREGSLIVVNSGEDLRARVVELLTDEGRRSDLASRAGRFVRDRLGATARIVAAVEARGWLGRTAKR
jgi:3-deoxy-D-manno-octulosonic-acid transferase